MSRSFPSSSLQGERDRNLRREEEKKGKDELKKEGNNDEDRRRDWPLLLCLPLSPSSLYCFSLNRLVDNYFRIDFVQYLVREIPSLFLPLRAGSVTVKEDKETT